MSITRKQGRWAATVAAATLALATLPTAGFALGGTNEARPLATDDSFAALTPASVDPRLAAFVAERTRGDARLMRFTPAGVSERGSRSVTVAVRVDEDAARAISVRTAIAAAMDRVAGDTAVRIAPTRFHLGLSRGYQNFAKSEAAPLSRSLSAAPIPDLDFALSPGAREEESRFAARIAPAEAAKTGVAPRTIEATREQSVELAGSYRLTRDLHVTAGVRYSQDHDRLAPIADSSKQDSQAVYVGTQFRF